MSSFDSLRHRNYRLLWTGALLSNTGTWMQNVALSWYVLVRTNSAFWVGLVNFANFIPLVLSPIGGLLADRVSRRRLLLIAQSWMMVQAAALTVLVTTGAATAPIVLAITFGMGLGIALHGPTWQAFVPTLVPRESMVNAIALNSAQYSLARVIGPGIGGALIALAGAGLVFGINAVSFLAVLAALVLVRPEGGLEATDAVPPAGLKEGFVEAWRNREVRALIAAITVTSLFAAPISALLPVFARDEFGVGAGGLGVLFATMGAGSVLGALTLARVGARRRQVRPVAVAMVVASVALGVFAWAPGMAAALPPVFVIGAAYLFLISAANSGIQLSIADAVRGRVMSIFIVAFGGFYPIGALVAGAAAEAYGPRV